MKTNALSALVFGLSLAAPAFAQLSTTAPAQTAPQPAAVPAPAAPNPSALPAANQGLSVTNSQHAKPGLAQSSGRIAFRSGTYEGELQGGVPNGYGVYSESNGYKIEGQFIQGETAGVMNLSFASGASSRAPMKNFAREGQGTMRWADGNTFDGEFRAGRLHFGTFRTTNGEVYTGGFIYNADNSWDYHGHGNLRYSNGAQYSGNFVNGKRQGDGIFTAVEGWRYSGSFNDNKIWTGTRTALDGSVTRIIENVAQNAAPAPVAAAAANTNNYGNAAAAAGASTAAKTILGGTKDEWKEIANSLKNLNKALKENKAASSSNQAAASVNPKNCTSFRQTKPSLYVLENSCSQAVRYVTQCDGRSDSGIVRSGGTAMAVGKSCGLVSLSN